MLGTVFVAGKLNILVTEKDALTNITMAVWVEQT